MTMEKGIGDMRRKHAKRKSVTRRREELMQRRRISVLQQFILYSREQ